MAKLPFVVQPKMEPVKIRIGNEDIGIFEIERKGYLSVAEKSFVDNFMSGSGGMRELISLSTKISATKKLKKETAYLAIMNVMGGEPTTKVEREIAEEYQEEITDISAQMLEVQSKRGIAIATVLLQSRVDSSWTVEDTFTIDPELINQLIDLYEKEDAKLRPELEERSEEEMAEEVVGK